MALISICIRSIMADQHFLLSRLHKAGLLLIWFIVVDWCAVSPIPMIHVTWMHDLMIDDWFHNFSNIMRKHAFFICKNKHADKLCSNCTADQHHRFLLHI